MFALVMTDSSNRKPPTLAPKHRVQSQDERDAEGFAARKERELAVPRSEFVTEEYTDKHEGIELDELRETRKPIDRIRRLERKGDVTSADLKDVRSDVKELSGHVSDLREDVAGAIGKIEGQAPVLSELLSIVKKSSDRDHVTFTAKVEVDKAAELAKTEVAKANELAKVEISKEEALDVYSARKARRKALLKGLGLVSSGAGLIELLHRLGVL
jgi:hypothetical protein